MRPSAFFLWVSLLLAACAGAAPPAAPPEPAPEPTPEVEAPLPVPLEEDPAPDGPACESGDTCEEGAQCRGPAGCMADWACGAPRECGEASVAYCACDGFSTFYALENCPGQPYQHVGPCGELGVEDDEPIEEVEGNSVCQSNADCRRGFVCAGVEGCSTFWTCVRRRRVRPRCGRSQEPFCGCSGDTFEASATCPGQPYLHRGYCPGDEPPPVVAEAEVPAVEAPPSVSAPPATAPPATASSPATAPATATAPPATASSPAPSSTPPVVAPSTEPPVAPPCMRNRDCPRGQTCQGPEGCGVEWHCARPAEPCIRDTQRFCSCGGQTFRASMTCPGRPHRHRGSCPEE